jgi:hypothetical protein
LGISYSQLTNIFQRGWNHQPDYKWVISMDLLDLVGTLSCRTNKPNRQFMGYSTSSRVVLEHLW